MLIFLTLCFLQLLIIDGSCYAIKLSDRVTDRVIFRKSKIIRVWIRCMCCCCCCCVLLLLFCVIFVDYSTIPQPLATIHRFTRWLRLLIDSYAVSMCFCLHMFNSSSQGECYFYFIQCFCPFWHQESGTVFYVAVKRCLPEIFSVFLTTFRLFVQRKQRSHQSMKTLIMATYRWTRAVEQKFPLWEQKFPLREQKSPLWK